jgi:hypothetical protein
MTGMWTTSMTDIFIIPMTVMWMNTRSTFRIQTRTHARQRIAVVVMTKTMSMGRIVAMKQSHMATMWIIWWTVTYTTFTETIATITGRLL